MTNRFLMSVATAALIAGTSFAYAQGTSGREAPAAGSTVQQSAPSSDRAGTSAAPMNHDAAEPKGASSGMKATQSEQKPAAAGKQQAEDQKSPAAGKNQRAEDNMQGQKSKGMSSEMNDTKGGKDMKAEGRDSRDGNKNAEGRQDRNGNMSAEGNKNADSKSQTTGQAGAGAKLSGEQRTKITSVIREQHVQPLTNVNFSISVGTRVPRDISFHALPTEIVTVYPEWRGYEYVLVNDQILVINPSTYEIVAVLDA